MVNTLILSSRILVLPLFLFSSFCSRLKTWEKPFPVLLVPLWLGCSGQSLRAVTRTCLCPGVSSPYIFEHHALGGLPWRILGGSNQAPINCWSKITAHQFRLVITVHTNILPLDHQAKLISSLFNEMTYQDKRITMVNHTYHWTQLL